MHVTVGEEAAVLVLVSRSSWAGAILAQGVVKGELDPVVVERHLLALPPLLFPEGGLDAVPVLALLVDLLLLEADYVLDLVQLARRQALDVVG